MKKLFFLFLFSTIAFSSDFSKNIDRAFKNAKQKQKPLLIFFSTLWCPYCQMMEEIVFPTSTFKEKSKNFVLLEVDADSDKSWKIKDRFQIGGYPTTVFVNPKGEEIFRVVGGSEPREFFRWMDLAVKNTKNNYQDLCRRETEEALWLCSMVCYDKKDLACRDKALVQLSKITKPGTFYFDEALGITLKTIQKPEEKKDQLERALKAHTQSPYAIYWVEYYLSSTEELKTTPDTGIINAVLNALPEVLKRSDLAQYSLNKKEIFQEKALILEKLGRREEAQKTWKVLADESTDSRADVLDKIFFLEQAGEKSAAIKLCEDWVLKYPKEFTFYFKKAQILERSKNYTEAILAAEKAYEFSYGDNKIRVATLLLPLYAAMQNSKKAMLLTQEIHAKFKPSAKLKIRTHRYLNAFETARKSATF